MVLQERRSRWNITAVSNINKIVTKTRLINCSSSTLKAEREILALTEIRVGHYKRLSNAQDISTLVEGVGYRIAITRIC